jgi:hypothetical protein
MLVDFDTYHTTFASGQYSHPKSVWVGLGSAVTTCTPNGGANGGAASPNLVPPPSRRRPLPTLTNGYAGCYLS